MLAMSFGTLLARALGATFVGGVLISTQACGQNHDGAPAAGGSGGSGGAGGSGNLGGAEAGRDGSAGGTQAPADGSSFSKRVLVDGLANPWEISWGPDGWLWVTERTGKRVLRIQPSDGAVRVVLEIDEARQDAPQDGLLGMALHPRLGAAGGENFVYVAYSYDASVGRRYKIRRYTYDAAADTLAAPQDLLTELPASTDHNAGRLLIGPDEKLYYTVGDQGENQFERKCNLDRAQELPTPEALSASDYQAYQGKILRLNLDGSVPDDNPVLGGVRSHIFSYGHRNPQGLAFGPTGVLFSSEQGPKTDDELNRIEPGKNYGWPQVAGFRDDKAYVYGNWSAAPDCEQLDYDDYTIPASVPQQKESEWNDESFAPPLLTFYTVESDYEFRDQKCGSRQYICWPTIAPSSLEFYSAERRALSGWSDSLLVTSLKRGTVFRVPLSDDGAAVSGDVAPLFKTTNRYRDVAVNPDGRTFYVITDSRGLTGSVDGGATDALENEGSVLEFSGE